MWNLYDDLYIGIPSGIRIEGCVIGERWTTVRANGNVGIARTMELPEDPAAFAKQFVGGFLRDTACHLRWKNLALAGVGVAAMNAWYNTAERVHGLEELQAAQKRSGKTAYVGDYEGKDVFALPTAPEFDPSPYQALPQYDTVVIAGEALITRALPQLLGLVGEGGDVILDGYCLPASALFFSFGMPVQELRGFYPRHIDTVEACAIKSLADPAPGMLPFCIRPFAVEKLHESAKAQAALNSPYAAVPFNNSFSG